MYMLQCRVLHLLIVAILSLIEKVLVSVIHSKWTS